MKTCVNLYITEFFSQKDERFSQKQVPRSKHASSMLQKALSD